MGKPFRTYVPSEVEVLALSRKFRDETGKVRIYLSKDRLSEGSRQTGEELLPWVSLASQLCVHV